MATRTHRIAPEQVPLEECGRLLSNRAVGIALSNLERSPDDQYRRARHGHKAILACGDARLLAAGRYRARLAERLSDLESLERDPSIGELVPAYREAVRFRERPDQWTPASGQSVEQWFAAVREQVKKSHLDYEAWRVGAPTDPASFARWRGRLYPNAPDLHRSRAALAAVRAAAEGAAPWTPYVGNPRERLARVAVALAYGPNDPACRTTAARLLGVADAQDDHALRDRLQRLVDRGG